MVPLYRGCVTSFKCRLMKTSYKERAQEFKITCLLSNPITSAMMMAGPKTGRKPKKYIVPSLSLSLSIPLSIYPSNQVEHADAKLRPFFTQIITYGFVVLVYFGILQCSTFSFCGTLSEMPCLFKPTVPLSPWPQKQERFFLPGRGGEESAEGRRARGGGRLLPFAFSFITHSRPEVGNDANVI